MIAKVTVSIGELLDKVSILNIKMTKIKDPFKKQEILLELTILEDEAKNTLSDFEFPYDLWIGRLMEVNEKLWEIEDNIRALEKQKRFDSEFINLARQVYITNDERFEIKNKINTITNSAVKEQKSYENYL